MSTPPRVGGGSISKLVGLRDFVPNLVGLSNPTILSSKFSGIKQSDHSEHPQISGNKCNFLSWVWRSAQALLGFFFACGGLKIIQSKLSKPPTVFCYFYMSTLITQKGSDTDQKSTLRIILLFENLRNRFVYTNSRTWFLASNHKRFADIQTAHGENRCQKETFQNDRLELMSWTFIDFPIAIETHSVLYNVM